MGALYKNTHKHISYINDESCIVEIGSDRGEGSTLYFAKLAEKYNVEFHTVDMLSTAQKTIQHHLINWHVGIGSEWCQTVYPKINKRISILYLDNFDYLWDCYYTSSAPDSVWNQEIYNDLRGASWPEEFTPYDQLPNWIQQEVINNYDISYDSMLRAMKEQYNEQGLELTNSNCQLEHFKQLYYLHSWLDENCVVIFDETFKYNDCWIGKNGPGVLLLQTLGFRLVDESNSGIDRGIILKRGQ